MKIGVSSCILGKECNYSGGHNRCRYVSDTLSKYVEFVPFCPEELVLGTPRETIRLVDDDGYDRVFGNKSKKEYTSELLDVSNSQIESIDGICGYIFKSKSPSCGIDAIKVYHKNGMPSSRSSSGIFAKAFMERFPYMPVIDDGRLNDAWLKENFIMQIFAYNSWLEFKKSSPSFGDLVEFHTKYKFLLQAKNENGYRALGKIVANHEKIESDYAIDHYGELFLKTIAIKNRLKPIKNVLEHMFGFLSDYISAFEKKELKELLIEFDRRVIPLIVVLKLLEHHINKHNIEYLKNQIFLSPYPSELGLRSDLLSYK